MLDGTEMSNKGRGAGSRPLHRGGSQSETRLTQARAISRTLKTSFPVASRTEPDRGAATTADCDGSGPLRALQRCYRSEHPRVPETLCARAPRPWMPFSVDAGLNNGLISNDPVEQRVRKAPEQNSPDVPAHDGEREWRARDQFNRCVDFGTELTAKAPALALVPLVGCLDVHRCCCPEDNEHRNLFEPLPNLRPGLPEGPTRANIRF
jgi:hypothetical protein